tara:strand:+ start:11568 stop:11942 length:375 start_codon:yes stop_codon:yes gene_type:complete
MPPKKAGAPKKPETVGSDKQVKARLYQRDYQAKIRSGIFELAQMEIDCDKELKQIKQDKAKLLNLLEKANNQTESILKEATADKKPTVKQMNASSVINRAVKGKVAKNALTQAEKDKTFNILLK